MTTGAAYPRWVTGHLDIVRTPLIQAAAVAQRLTRWWAAYLVAFGIVVVSALLVTPVVVPLQDLGLPFQGIAATLLLHVGILLLLMAWLRWYERRPLRTVGFARGTDRGQVLRGFGVGVALSVLVTIVLLILGAVHLTPTEAGTIRWGALLPAVVLVPVWLFLAAVQEALTRGFLLQATGLRLAAWTAIAGQAVLWAAVRAASAGATDLMALLNLVLIGMALALVALTRGSLWLAMGIQAGWSWFETGVLGIPTSGGPEPAAVLSLVPTAASWVSGGAAGVIASPLVTVLVVAVGYRTYRTLQRETAPTVIS